MPLRLEWREPREREKEREIWQLQSLLCQCLLESSLSVAAADDDYNDYNDDDDVSILNA